MALALLAMLLVVGGAADGGAELEKLDETLRARLEQAGGAAEAVPVIVTLTAGADSAGLAACGLAIAHRFPAIGAVSGRIAAGDLAKLAARPEVARVEYDGEVRALDRP